MPVLVRTTDFAPNERAEAWCSAVSSSFVPLDFSFPDSGPFYGEVIGATLGDVVVTQVTAGAHRAQRTQRHVARSDEPGYYKLSLLTRGRVVISQDGRVAALTPGDLAIYDTSRPYEVVFDDTSRMLVLMFPHRDLRLPRSAMRSATARCVSGRHGLGGLVSPLLVNLAGRLDEVGEGESARLADNVVDLVATLYATQVSGDASWVTDSMRTLLVRIKAFIEEHLDDPELGPESIAAACYVSTGYLHKLFRAEDTSVSRFIRERRLEQCRHDLLDPGWRATAVSTIGARWGFVDAAHFSRVFKAAYGTPPREYRLSRDVTGQVRVTASTGRIPG